MRALLILSALTLTTALLSACGGGKEDSQVTETRMDDIDSLEGTISDDMINTDESTDEGPFDAAPATAPKPKAKADREENAESDNTPDPKVDDKAEAE